VAHHRGVWSLGLLLVIGSVMTLTTSLVVLPTLMRLRGQRVRWALAIVGRDADTNGIAAPGPPRAGEPARARERARWAGRAFNRMWNMPDRERLSR